MGIVALDDCARCEPLVQQLDEERLEAFGALRERLDRKAVAIPIDDERTDEIAFAVHDPVGRRAFNYAFAQCDGIVEPPLPECTVGLDVVERHEPNRNERRVAVERAAKGTAPRIDDTDDVAPARRADVGHVASVDPMMAGASAIGALLRNGDSGGHEGRSALSWPR